MKIAINCIFLQPKGGGIKEYIYNLVNSIAAIDHENTYLLYVLKDQVAFARQMFPQQANMHIRVVPYTSDRLSVVWRSISSGIWWRREEAKEEFDIFHSPFFHAPRLRHAKVVITIHDLRFARYPYTYTYARYQFVKRAVRKSVYSCDHIITISDFTKSEVMEIYQVPSSKINVIHEAINRQDFSTEKIANYSDETTKQLQNKRFLLSVGHVEPRKNYGRLVDAFQNLRDAHREDNISLVIVGKKEHHYEADLEKMRNTEGVIYLDFVSRELLLWLYQHAAALVFPSIYEGFGFPPLEAACMGTISTVARLSSLPEVCGEAAYYFDPTDTADITKALGEVLYNTTVITKQKESLEKNLSRFSWEKNAKDTIKLYHNL